MNWPILSGSLLCFVAAVALMVRQGKRAVR